MQTHTIEGQTPINDKKVVNAWAIFDWANSAYALVISTAIFPIYFVENTPDLVNFLGLSVKNTALYSYAVAGSYLIIALLSPLLSGIADYSGRRMFFLKFFTIIGSLACVTLYFFNGEPALWLGTFSFILATIGFAGSIVFYNAYLPEIVTEDQYDRVSAKGYAYGYVGSVILLIMNLVIILKPELFGIKDAGLPARIGFVMVGVWWIGFAQYTFRHLPKDMKTSFGENAMARGVKELKSVYHKLKKKTNVKRFLLAYFFYIAGVNTVIYLATTFAKKELQFETYELIIIVLILQLVGVGGAYFFAYLSKIRSNKFSLLSMNFIWIGICIAAFFVESKLAFYIIAAMVGMVMGGIQSLSRSSYTKLLEGETKDLTSHFSFYDVLTKVSIVAGTFLFALITQLTTNLRYPVLVLIIFFALGIIILFTIKIERGKT